MNATAATDRKAQCAAMFLGIVLIGVVAVLPVHWRPAAKRVWSYGVYYLGYRLLSVQMSCGSLAVSGIPFVMKHV